MFQECSVQEGQIFHSTSHKMKMIVWGEDGKPDLRLGQQNFEPALAV
jgi:hypothetical protein